MSIEKTIKEGFTVSFTWNSLKSHFQWFSMAYYISSILCTVFVVIPALLLFKIVKITDFSILIPLFIIVVLAISAYTTIIYWFRAKNASILHPTYVFSEKHFKLIFHGQSLDIPYEVLSVCTGTLNNDMFFSKFVVKNTSVLLLNFNDIDNRSRLDIADLFKSKLDINKLQKTHMYLLLSIDKDQYPNIIEFFRNRTSSP